MNKNQEIKTGQPFIHKVDGADTAVLLLHGFGGVAKDLDLFLKYLTQKGYSIFTPYFSGYEKKENYQKEYLHLGPKDWMKDANEWLDQLAQEYKNVFIVGFSFGGNIGLELAKSGNSKVKGVVLLEVPIFFRPKIVFMMTFLQPLLRILKVSAIKPNPVIYRKGCNKSGATDDSRIPVAAVGKIFKFIRRKTRKNLDKIKTPILIIQAEESDLIRKKSSKYVYYKVGSDKKEIYYLQVDNHDFNLMDEEGKILMVEKINKFINSLK